MNKPDATAIELGEESAEVLFNPPSPREQPQANAPPPLLLAIGDSWFNYWPRGDILDVLEDQLGCEVQRCAKAGRPLSEMLYATASKTPGPLDGEAVSWLVTRLKSLTPAEQARLRAVLISAGGNDVAADPEALRSMVIPKKSVDRGSSPLNADAVRDFVDGRLRGMFVSLLACVNRTFEKAGLPKVPIFLHGYSYPVPDGRGVLGAGWLMKPLVDLGYEELASRREIMRLLIDRLNEMQRSLIAANPGLSNVVHVDVRPALDKKEDYKLYWQNELHPTIPVGFVEVTKIFIAQFRSVAQAPSGVRPAPDARPSPSSRTPRRPSRAAPRRESALHDPA
jgi:hypothetical protein